MRLLLCEQDSELSQALIIILKHNHFSIDTVKDTAEALEYIATENYDCFIIDLPAPVQNHLSIISDLRKDGFTIPVMILCTDSGIDDKVAGLDSGADDYIVKPFAIKELLARVRALTRRTLRTSDTKIRFGNIVLDRVSFKLIGPNGQFRLANKEFQILEMMMSNPEHLVPTERFMQKIWGFDTEAEINVVWVYMSYIRKKLKDVGANIKIKATRNMGYSLEES